MYPRCITRAAIWAVEPVQHTSTQDSIIARFDETGTVETWQGTVRSGHLEPPNRKMSAAAEQARERRKMGFGGTLSCLEC